METSYRVSDHSGKNGTRKGVFLKYKIVAVIAIVVLVTLVLLAAFLGPGRKRSSSESCDNNSGQRSSIGKTFLCR